MSNFDHYQEILEKAKETITKKKAEQKMIEAQIRDIVKELNEKGVDYKNIDKPRGLQITINTTANNREEGKRLLELLGMPFKKGENRA